MASEERCFLQKREKGSLSSNKQKRKRRIIFHDFISSKFKICNVVVLSLYSKIYVPIECWILRFVPFILESSLPALAIVTFKPRFGPK